MLSLSHSLDVSNERGKEVLFGISVNTAAPNLKTEVIRFEKQTKKTLVVFRCGLPDDALSTCIPVNIPGSSKGICLLCYNSSREQHEQRNTASS